MSHPLIWNCGLLFATFTVVLGVSAFVTARQSLQRHFACGMILQGILISFVIAASVYDRSIELKLGGLAVLGLLLAQSIWSPERFAAVESVHGDVRG